MQSMKSAVMPDLLQCNTEAGGGKGRFQTRVWAFGMLRPAGHSAVGMLKLS